MSRTAAAALACLAALSCAAQDSAPKPYVIGSADVLYVQVSSQPELTGLVTVHSDGMVSLGPIGKVKAAGSTPEQLQEAIAARLKEDLREGEVNVRVVKSGKPQP